MPAFLGGPFDGQSMVEEDERQGAPMPPGGVEGGMMSPPDDGGMGGLEAMLGGGGQAPPPGQEEEPDEWESMPEVQHFDKLMLGVRALNNKLDSEQNRLKLEKVTTLLQEIRAQDEKEEESAMTGTLSPRMMKRGYQGRPSAAYSGGAGGGAPSGSY